MNNPIWSADGSQIIYELGTYWYDGSALRGGSGPWTVASAGGAPPTTFPTSFGCSVINPSRNPATGEVLFIHSVCVPGTAGNGMFLYPATGGDAPKELVPSGTVEGMVDLYLSQAAWAGDGSGFAFIGSTAESNHRPALLAYDAKTTEVSLLAVEPEGAIVSGVAVSPDIDKVVYSIRADADSSTDLYLIDLSTSPATTTALTTDGRSYQPSF